MSGTNRGDRRGTDDVQDFEAMVAGRFWFGGTGTFQARRRVISPFLQVALHIAVKSEIFASPGLNIIHFR